MVDTAVVGKYVSADGLAGMRTTTPVITLILGRLPACKAGNQTFPYHYTVCGAWTDVLCSFAWKGFHKPFCSKR